MTHPKETQSELTKSTPELCSNKTSFSYLGNFNKNKNLHDSLKPEKPEILNNNPYTFYRFISDLLNYSYVQCKRSTDFYEEEDIENRYQYNKHQWTKIPVYNEIWRIIRNSQMKILNANIVLFTVVTKGYRSFIIYYFFSPVCKYDSERIFVEQYSNIIPINNSSYMKRLRKVWSDWFGIFLTVGSNDCKTHRSKRSARLPTNGTMETCSMRSSDMEARRIIQVYIFPTIYIVFLVVGLAGNGTLLIIFIKDKESRTAPNTMILNLAIVDTLNLVLNTPLYYITKYHSDMLPVGEFGCKVFVIYRMVNLAVMYVSVVALSAQRYFAIKSTLRPDVFCCRMSSRASVVFNIFIVWFVSLGIGFPPAMLFEYRPNDCFPHVKDGILKKYMDMTYIFCGSAFPPLFVTIFNVLTARLLKQSIRECPGVVRNNAQKLERYRSARVVIAFSIAFCICYIPRNAWIFIAINFPSNHKELKFICIDEATLYLLISNSLLNPIALYIACKFFRERFNAYLFRRRPQEESTRNVTLPTTQRTARSSYQLQMHT